MSAVDLLVHSHLANVDYGFLLLLLLLLYVLLVLVVSCDISLVGMYEYTLGAPVL